MEGRKTRDAPSNKEEDVSRSAAETDQHGAGLASEFVDGEDK